MSEFYKERKVEGLKRLGDFLLEPDDDFKDILSFAKHKNGWFTLEEVSKAVAANGKMLNIADLETWLAGYKIESHEPKKIGLILAGNLPLVGFHDIISVLMSGNIALIKLSSQDDILIPAILKKLIAIEPEFENQIQYVERLENFDAVIA
ncbi:MAG: acyl-CoA reductase, partial [Bacteroidetes bacterium]|nr:acyl-CoA reductase [Bacteroidota bacterium]MBU1759675.1 acyl-CoA reductase [Bacteroidota bacterium]